MNSAQIFVIVPLTYVETEYLKDYSNTIMYTIFMEADSIGYNCGIMLILTLTIDRFIIFLNKFGQHSRKFRSILFSILSWLYGIIIMTLNNVFEVKKGYDRENFSIIVTINDSNPHSISFITFTQNFSRVVPFIILGLYIFCIASLKKFNNDKNITSENQKLEKKLLIQGLAFVLFYEFEALLFYQRDFILSIIGNHNIKYYLVVLNFFVIMYTCFNSIALYIFVDKARKHLKSLITCKMCNYQTYPKSTIKRKKTNYI